MVFVVPQLPTFMTFHPPGRAKTLPQDFIWPGAMTSTTTKPTGFPLVLCYVIDNGLVAEGHLTLLASLFALNKCNGVFQKTFLCSHTRGRFPLGVRTESSQAHHYLRT